MTEDTSDYLTKRNARMRHFTSVDKKAGKHILSKIGLRDQLKILNDPMRLTNGFVSNQEHVQRSQHKGKF